MPAARTIVLTGCLGLALAVSAAGGSARGAAAPEAAPSGTGRAKASGSGYDYLKPLLMEADAASPRSGSSDAADRDAAGRTAVRVDPAARAVAMPVRVTHARGAVEWLLSAGTKHRRMSVLLARCPVRSLARALEEAGLKGGRPPEPVGEDAARPPEGPAVRLTLRFDTPDGTPGRVPAEDLLAAAPDGTPLPTGRWVYVGPQTLADGKILLPQLSGTLVTTALRDTTGLVYWVPSAAGDGPRYIEAFYARKGVVPAGVTEAVLEIRPAREPKP